MQSKIVSRDFLRSDVAVLFGIALVPLVETSLEYAMPYENGLPIMICRKPKDSLKNLWPQTKIYS